MHKHIVSPIIAGITLFLVNAVSAQTQLYPNQFPLGDVRITSGPFQHARDLNIKVLLEYNTDRLLAPYRKEAGLLPKDSSFTNWDGLDGHVGGHYLTALALNYAATGNEACGQRLRYMVSELKTCMEAHDKNHAAWGKGYIGGVPQSERVWAPLLKADFTAYHRAWVPWYNVHKMYAGLRDAWLYAGNADAKQLFLRFCDWAIFITANLSEAQMEAMLDTEHGGMNEVLADAFQMTGDKKYLVAAKRFSHRQLLDAMAAGKDNLDNKHANTQVPKAIGFKRIGELAQDADYNKAGSFFWETVTGHRTLAFGGNSRREHFPAVAACTDFVNDVEGPESCNTYNMLKLTQDLFRTAPNAAYMDYFENALYNHILATQHPGHGGYVYFTPSRPQHYRVYSAPNAAMWCCVGSGMENHGKYNEMIYTHQQDSLFVNLFIPSTLHWKAKGLELEQQTDFPFAAQTKLKINSGKARFTMMIRYPGWVKAGELKLLLNGKVLDIIATPTSYVTVDREWKKGDVLEVQLPMHPRVVAMPNVPAYSAIMYGPILLAAKAGTDNLKGLVADDSRWAHIATGPKLPLDQAPVVVEDDLQAMLQKLIPLPGKPLHFSMDAVHMQHSHGAELQPFFQVHDSRYMMYWMMLSEASYEQYIDSLATAEKEMIALQQRTVDAVAPGEQQPEADHFMEAEKSTKGVANDAFFREASSEGYFSYKMQTGGNTNLALYVRYWGAEWGNRKLAIYIDGEKLVEEDNTGRWNTTGFKEVSYTIPSAMVSGKNSIRVKFEAAKGSTAGAVYFVRLVKR